MTNSSSSNFQRLWAEMPKSGQWDPAQLALQAYYCIQLDSSKIDVCRVVTCIFGDRRRYGSVTKHRLHEVTRNIGANNNRALLHAGGPVHMGLLVGRLVHQKNL